MDLLFDENELQEDEMRQGAKQPVEEDVEVELDMDNDEEEED